MTLENWNKDHAHALGPDVERAAAAVRIAYARLAEATIGTALGDRAGPDAVAAAHQDVGRLRRDLDRVVREAREAAAEAAVANVAAGSVPP